MRDAPPQQSELFLNILHGPFAFYLPIIPELLRGWNSFSRRKGQPESGTHGEHFRLSMLSIGAREAML